MKYVEVLNILILLSVSRNFDTQNKQYYICYIEIVLTYKRIKQILEYFPVVYLD